MLPRFGLAPRQESSAKRQPRARPQPAYLRKRRFAFERLEFRRVLATITWDGGAGTLNWNDANNWSTDAVPGLADTAVIPDLAGTPTISFTTATRSVGAIQTHENVSVVSGTLTIGASLSGSGRVTISGGTVTFSGNNWANTASLSLVSGSLNLGGSFVQASLGSFTRSGGTVSLVGILTGNLTLDTATGPWLFGGNGTLKDSQLVSNTPVIVASNFTLDNVTIASGTDLQVLTGGGALSVRNGLTVNGRLSVGSATTAGIVSLTTTQTIAGSGEIVFSAATANIVSTPTSGLTFTYGPNLTLRGKNVTFGGSSNYVFQGLVQPDVSGGLFEFGIGVSSATLSGRIEPLNGSSLNYSGGTFTNNGQVVVTATNTVRLTSTGAHVNNGSITATGGALTIGGQLNNLGSIAVSNTSVTLAGSLTQFALGSASPAPGQGTFTRSAGTVSLTAFLLAT